MIVGARMPQKVFTVSQRDRVQKAFELMKRHRIRHLPVLEGERLVGIITDRDIRYAFVPADPPDPKKKNQGTAKNAKDAFYLPKDSLVGDFMAKNPITVTPQTPIEEAARLIYHHKIGGLPVLEGDRLVGIITETDILAVFIEIMGVIGASSRLDVVLGPNTNAFEEVSRIIKGHQVDIISVGMSAHADKAKRVYYFRIEMCEVEPIVRSLNQAGYTVVSAIS